MKKLTALLPIMLAISIFAGCSGGGSSGNETVIRVTGNGWDSQNIHNEIARIVVENAYDGYILEQSNASTTMNWQSLLKSEIDLDIESWTENVASYSEDLANGDVLELGVLVSDSKQGLYVPRYVIEGDAEQGIQPMAPELKTVEDLKKYAHVFPNDENPNLGQLHGAVPGWMADEVLYKKFEYYGLDEYYAYNRLGGESQLFASLSAAYNLGKPWLGYCYEPTVVSGKLDLVLLEDAPYDESLYLDGKCEFPSQELKIISSSKFPEKAPDLVEFFENYKTGSKIVASALGYMDDTKSNYEETAIWVLKENDELIDQWLPKENAAKLRNYLSTLS